jgi:CcmD family protein
MPDTYFDLFLGYTAIWVLVAVYLFTVMREQRQQRLELDELRGKILPDFGAGVGPQAGGREER